MRFLTTIILLFATVLTCGCRARNATSLTCERETALLRAEILDLEDKYYALKSQYESSPGAGSTTIANAGYVGSGVVTSQSTPVYVDSQSYSTPIIHGEVIQGDVIYEDQTIPQAIYGTVPGTVIPGTIIPGTVLPSTIVPETVLPSEQFSAPTLASPSDDSSLEDGQSSPDEGITEPPTSTEDSSAFNLETPEFDSATSDLNDLMLPDDDLDLDLEVGYENIELELGGGGPQIDRLEIIPTGTRGKDLDGIPGHDGLELMVKTVNSDGDFVEHQGEMTITVEDQLAGEIGKWTFLPQELRLFLSRDELGNMGTLLHLPWTGKIPVSQQVEIRVSVMVDNIEYIATHNVSIEPPTGRNGPAIVGWGDDNRWVSVPNTSRPNIDYYSPTATPSPSQQAENFSSSPQGFSTPPRFKPSRPQASIERPQWKPVR